MKIVSRKITEATVNNLNPGREYEFMVLSQDKHGDGMFSKTLRIFTQPRTFRAISYDYVLSESFELPNDTDATNFRSDQRELGLRVPQSPR